MKKIIFAFLATMMLCLPSQAQMMNAALRIADYAIRVDAKTAQKVMKKEGFKKITRRGDIIYYRSKELDTDGMLIMSGDNVDYLKFLFPTFPSPREVEGSARQCGYRFIDGMGPDRKFRKGPLVLYTSPVNNDPNYAFGFVIKYEPMY